jgi:hypothetical protein
VDSRPPSTPHSFEKLAVLRAFQGLGCQENAFFA